MQNEDLFLDTCIFLSHAHGFERFSGLCEKLFNEDDYKRYTSQTVINELDGGSKRRKDAYKKLILMLDNTISIDAIKGIIEKLGEDTYLTDNDKQHILEIVEHLRSRLNSEDMPTRFNNWRKAANLRLGEARKGLTKIAPRNNDVYVKYIIQSNINNKYDSEIIMDAFEFSIEMDHLSFVTTDYTDIYKNKLFILEQLTIYRGLKPESFGIFHIIDFINAS
jgi:hypothetical protein